MAILTGHTQQAMIKKYTINEGLVMNRVRGFHQDAQGFIWIYTWDGLSRFEGYRFRNYIGGEELSHGLINDIIDNPDGSMNIALNDGTIEVIKDLEVQQQLRKKGIIINNFLTDKQGKILAGTDHEGICLFTKDSIKPISDLISGVSVHVAVLKNNTLYMTGVRDLFVAGIEYSDNSISGVKLLYYWDFGFEYVNDLFLNNTGDVLVCTAEGLKQFIPHPDSSGKFQLIQPYFISQPEEWMNWPTLCVTQSDDGTYWIGTENGLIRRKNKNDWSLYTTSDNLPSNSVNSLFIDRNNTLWIGTELGVGSLRFDNSIERYHNPNCDYINHILPDPHNGMYCLCENNFTYLLSPKGEIKEFMRDHEYSFGLISHQGIVYLLHAGGIRPIDTITPVPYWKPVSSTRSGAIINHSIYVLTYGGLFRCPLGADCIKLSGIDYRMEAIYGIGDQLLIGTWDEGLFIASLDKKDSTRLIIDSKLNKFLPGKEIRSLMVSKNGDIWVGTRYHGILRLECDEPLNNCHVQTFTMKDGMIGNWITCMTEDQHGNIWVGSKSGIDKLIPDSDSYRVFSYSHVFGYYDVINHLAVSTDGTVWAGTSTGHTLIKDGNLDTLPASQAYITEIIVGGNESISFANSLNDLPYNKNNIKFAFSAPDFISEKQLQFSYRLTGSSDAGWSSPAKIHEIFFSNLQPGDYIFQVAAIGWNGERGHPASYSFTIIPPFWRQWWFVSFVIVMTGAALYALYRFRISQIQRVQSMRERIASDLHDEIGSSLSHVNILAEIGKQSMAHAGKSADILERIGAEVQNSSEALDDIIWSVKTRWDAIGDVVARMRQYATEVFEPNGMSFRIAEEISVDPHPDMEFRRDLFLVYKEILRNIIRHADATHVDIEIRIESKIVKLAVTDNGMGFIVDQPTQRSGLNNIRVRAGRWKGRADWISAPGSGTTVTVVMKPD